MAKVKVQRSKRMYVLIRDDEPLHMKLLCGMQSRGWVIRQADMGRIVMALPGGNPDDKVTIRIRNKKLQPRLQLRIFSL